MKIKLIEYTILGKRRYMVELNGQIDAKFIYKIEAVNYVHYLINKGV